MQDHIEHISPRKLIPYGHNARTHSPAQTAQIAASIREFGFTNPILIDASNGVIAGHGRLLAAQDLGLATVPCLRLAHLTDAQRRAYVLADNQLALNAGWDIAVLAKEIEALRLEDFDLNLTGFDMGELERMFAEFDQENAPAPLTDPDATPPPPVEPVTQPGDIWVMDKHRLMCGDSTDADNVIALLGGCVPHLMVTDPPYGVEYDPSWRNKTTFSDGKNHSGRAVGEVLNDNRADWREAWEQFPGEVAYVWHAGTFTHVVADSLVACGYKLYSMIVWGKNNLVIGRGHYHSKHEPCWYAVKKGGTGHWQGDRTQTTLWNIDKPLKSETGHSTQKPIECMRIPIENNSQPGDAIYEPFSGSGTTIIAAEQTGRRCYAMELSPQYVDVAVQRWQQFTGRTAVHAGTGQSFNYRINLELSRSQGSPGLSA